MGNSFKVSYMYGTNFSYGLKKNQIPSFYDIRLIFLRSFSGMEK